MIDFIISHVVFVVMVVAVFTFMDKISGVNYRTHLRPDEMK